MIQVLHVRETNQLAYHLLGCSLLQLDRAWWAVRLKGDEWVCEARTHTDPYTGQERHFEWYEDLVQNDDVKDIIELWLFCPPNHLSPLGNTARLPIIEPFTAFNFKIAHATSNFIETWRGCEAHIIGRVDSKATGDCTCLIWDEKYQMLTQPWQTNIHNFGSWRSDLAPRGPLAFEKMGVRL